MLKILLIIIIADEKAQDNWFLEDVIHARYEYVDWKGPAEES